MVDEPGLKFMFPEFSLTTNSIIKHFLFVGEVIEIPSSSEVGKGSGLG